MREGLCFPIKTSFLCENPGLPHQSWGKREWNLQVELLKNYLSGSQIALKQHSLAFEPHPYTEKPFQLLLWKWHALYSSAMYMDHMHFHHHWIHPTNKTVKNYPWERLLLIWLHPRYTLPTCKLKSHIHQCFAISYQP